MFSWVQELISGISESITTGFKNISAELTNSIWTSMVGWFYETVFSAISDFFALMGNMGAEIFDLKWVQAMIHLFTLFGWALFIAGLVVAVFDVAIEYQNGRANIKTTAINILKGFFACSLIGIVPVELYKFCISLQNTFSQDLSMMFADGKVLDLSAQSAKVFAESFTPTAAAGRGVMHLLIMIAFAYCVIKIFFQNSFGNTYSVNGGTHNSACITRTLSAREKSLYI